jgi:diadenosine tetraphosphate (Ap4A) HIT family hydrolase
MPHNTLYAPWRDDYFKEKSNVKGCVFCHISQNKDQDRANHVLFRDEYCFVVMNKYPYSTAHFMIIPHTHTANLEELDTQVWLHISKLAQQGVKMLKEIVYAEGVNIGMNLGEAAGAGIAPHLHLHLLPRYRGDTNFISTIAEVRVYPKDFEAIYEQLQAVSERYFG